MKPFHQFKAIKPPRIAISILIAFLLRCMLVISVWIATGGFLTSYSYDTNDYLVPANEWLKTGSFTNQGIPELLRTPGYPIFLMPGIILGHVEIVTLILQIIIGTMNVFILYRLIKRLKLPESVALWGTFFYAIEPATILYTCKLLTETFFTFVFLLFALTLAKYFQNKKRSILLLSAILLSGVVYIRPIGYYLPIFLLIIILSTSCIKLINKNKPIMPLNHLLLFFVISMSFIGIWQVRNFLLTGFSGFSSFDGINLYFFHGASVEAAKLKIPLYDLQNQMGYRDQTIYWQLHPEQKSWSKARISQYLSEQGKAMILSDLPKFSVVYAFGLVRTLLDPSGNEYLRLFNSYNIPSGVIGSILDQGIIEKFKKIYNLIIHNYQIIIINMLLGLLLLGYYIFAIIGLTQCSTWKNKHLLIILSIGLYLLLLAGGAVGVDRLRVPFMSVLCIPIGIGFNKIFETKSVDK